MLRDRAYDSCRQMSKVTVSFVWKMASNSTNTGKLLEFMTLVGQLKKVKRTGWVLRGIQDAESVSDHMYRMSIMTFLLETDKDGINKERCMKLALVHDMAECIVGDIAPADGISKDEKHRREKEAMERLSGLVTADIGREIYSLWEEYEFQSSKEARLVKELDRFEMILQAHEYEQDEKRFGELQDFFESTKGKFQHPVVKKWVAELYEKRAISKEESS
ncbi:5'-deoxynucleotidase HDDC2-like [Ptychodera flava]|uniref:5'-deoxynucleotidase HDDC2-like n=1 Tax=Ptychodera flava TaxID=63121 RepID=UPI00396A9041